MAYAITASKWLDDKRYIEAVLDSAADLAALGDGYAPDSRAIVAEGGAAYMTDASGQWQELGSPGGGGGSSVTVEPLTVTQNGTQTAPSGKAFNPVAVNVPNSYDASDEGKVVNNGALVAQTAHAPVTQNGTIDTTLYNSVPVNVSGSNPNYVETITGTIGDIFNDIDFDSFVTALSNNDITAFLQTPYAQSNYGEPIVGYAYSGAVFFSGGIASTVNPQEPYMGVLTIIYSSGNYDTSVDEIYSKTHSDYHVNGIPQSDPCTLTIIHHPLPDSE